MDVASLKTALKRYAGVDDSDPLLVWLNAAMHDFEDAEDWPFLEKESIAITLSSTYEMSRATPPADLFRPIYIRNRTTGNKITYVSPKGYMDQGYYDAENSTNVGEPEFFTWMNSQLFFYPAPGVTYDLWMLYTKALPDLVNDSDVPAIPTRYHYGLVFGAASYALQAESEEDRAGNAQTQFEGFIERAANALVYRQGGEEDSVRDVMDYASQ